MGNVVRFLRARYDAALRGLSKHDSALRTAAKRCFGGLLKALVASGLKNLDSETDTR